MVHLSPPLVQVNPTPLQGIRTVQSALADEKADKERLQVEADEWHHKFDEMEIKVVNLQARFDGKQSEVEELERQLARLQAQLDKSELSGARSEAEGSAMAQLQAKNAEYVSTIATMKSALEATNARVNELHAKCEQQSKEAAELHKTLEQAKERERTLLSAPSPVDGNRLTLKRSASVRSDDEASKLRKEVERLQKSAEEWESKARKFEVWEGMEIGEGGEGGHSGGVFDVLIPPRSTQNKYASEVKALQDKLSEADARYKEAQSKAQKLESDLLSAGDGDNSAIKIQVGQRAGERERGEICIERDSLPPNCGLALRHCLVCAGTGGCGAGTV